jgi:hypothetical protein
MQDVTIRIPHGGGQEAHLATSRPPGETRGKEHEHNNTIQELRTGHRGPRRAQGITAQGGDKMRTTRIKAPRESHAAGTYVHNSTIRDYARVTEDRETETQLIRRRN